MRKNEKVYRHMDNPFGDYAWKSWMHVGKCPAMDIYALKIPSSSLRPVKEIPLFDWARQETVEVWMKLSAAFKAKSALPEPPAVDQCIWAPSGMEDLDDAFKWAIRLAETEKSDEL